MRPCGFVFGLSFHVSPVFFTFFCHGRQEKSLRDIIGSFADCSIFGIPSNVGGWLGDHYRADVFGAVENPDLHAAMRRVLVAKRFQVLSERSQHIVVIARLSFDPNIRFLQVIANGAEKYLSITQFPEWQSNGQHILFRSKEVPFFFHVDYRSVQSQSLGYNEWTKQKPKVLKFFSQVLHDFKIEVNLELEFQVFCFLDTKMTHTEMAELMFGSFLPLKENLPKSLLESDDGRAVLEINNRNRSIHVAIGPLTKKQAVDKVNAVPNLAVFNSELELRTTVDGFRRSVERECLEVYLLVKSKGFHPSKLETEIDAVEREADAIVSECVSFLRAVPNPKP